MDLAEYIKRGLMDLHKPKITDHKKQCKEQRQRLRYDVMLDKRRIENPASPVVPTSNRMEQLIKWKAERDKRKSEEKAKKKPFFVAVCRTETKSCIEPRDNFQIVKGKHEFKTPLNVKPIQFSKRSADANKLGDNKEKRITRSHTWHMDKGKSAAMSSSSKTQMPVSKSTRKAR